MKIEDVSYLSKLTVREEDALIIVDVQNDFMPYGALPVDEGDIVVDPINHLAKQFHSRANIIAMTQDWHPKDHLSFASSHHRKPYDLYESEGIGPILWPDHCVQGTEGAEFHPQLEVKYAKAIIRKGYNPKIDSYSAFLENDQKTSTGLSGYLKSQGIQRIIICGLTLDYCVYYSAIDGNNLNFEVVVVIDLTRAVNSPPNHLSEALSTMEKNHISFIQSKDLDL